MEGGQRKNVSAASKSSVVLQPHVPRVDRSSSSSSSSKNKTALHAMTLVGVERVVKDLPHDDAESGSTAALLSLMVQQTYRAK